MAFLTEAAARSASGLAGFRLRAERELRKSAATATSTQFDVFLSHSVLDAEVIAGVVKLLEHEGLRVYVDWIEDRQLSRAQVTPATAQLLRVRMRHSKSLIFATSDSSASSKWMPWELGYFDGYSPGHVAILPLLRSGETAFRGQEYLGLYPVIESVGSIGARQRLAIFPGSARMRPITIGDFVAGGVTLTV